MIHPAKMFKIHSSIHTNIVRTFFSCDDAISYLRSIGAHNGISGWHRVHSDGTVEHFVVRNELGWCITI